MAEENRRIKILKKKKEVCETVMLEIADQLVRNEIDIDYYNSLLLTAKDKKKVTEYMGTLDLRKQGKEDSEKLLRAILSKIDELEAEIEKEVN